jgi:hypothetical protein
MPSQVSGVRGICTACGRTSPPEFSHCGFCGRVFSPSPLNGRPIAEALPFQAPTPPGSTAPGQMILSNIDRITCPTCGANQSSQHIHCSACGVRLAPKIIESNRKAFKRPLVPLFHPRLVIRDRNSGEPERRTWGDRVARLYFNVSLLALMAYGLSSGGWIPPPVQEAARERIGQLTFRWPSMPEWLTQKLAAAQSAEAPAPPAPAAPGTDQVRQAPAGREPVVVFRSEGSQKPDKDVQIGPYRLERDGDRFVALGELLNTSKNDAVSVVVTFTFYDRVDEVVDVAKAEIGLLPAGDKQAWKVAVPYRASVARSGIDVQWVTRPPRT